MVLESLFKSEIIMKHPLFSFLLGFITSSVSLWVSFIAFPSHASILSIAFVTIATVPLIHSVFVKEEELEAKSKKPSTTFLGRNISLLAIYAFFSIGVISSYTLWYIVLPNEESHFCIEKACYSMPSKNIVFAEQNNTLEGIGQLRESITGKATLTKTGIFKFNELFNLIFFNNVSVLLYAVLFSFLFGAGAIYLITWNSSVVGVLIGETIIATNHFAFLGLLPHGIPEFTGYFLGAISGGLISVAVSKGKYMSTEFETIAKDSFILLIVAFFSLLMSGIIETFLVLGEIARINGFIGEYISLQAYAVMAFGGWLLIIVLLVLKAVRQ